MIIKMTKPVFYWYHTLSLTIRFIAMKVFAF
jgi:hypothetical protein